MATLPDIFTNNKRKYTLRSSQQRASVRYSIRANHHAGNSIKHQGIEKCNIIMYRSTTTRMVLAQRTKIESFYSADIEFDSTVTGLTEPKFEGRDCLASEEFFHAMDIHSAHYFRPWKERFGSRQFYLAEEVSLPLVVFGPLGFHSVLYVTAHFRFHRYKTSKCCFELVHTFTSYERLRVRMVRILLLITSFLCLISWIVSA
jgi:hypothetical protein